MTHCQNCQNGDHDCCLMDPPFNLCDCSKNDTDCEGKKYTPSDAEGMLNEICMIAGPDSYSDDFC